MIKSFTSEALEDCIDGAPFPDDVAGLWERAEAISVDGALARLALTRLVLDQDELVEARAHLARCHQTLRQLQRASDPVDPITWRLLVVRLDTIHARLAWQRGTRGDAARYVSDALENLESLRGVEVFRQQQIALERARLPLALLEAELRLAQGDIRQAETTLEEHLRIAQHHQSALVTAFHRGIGGMQLQQGKPVVAGHHLRLALDRVVTGQQPKDEIELYLLLTRAALMRTEEFAAQAYVEHAAALAHKHVLPFWLQSRIAMYQAMVEDQLAGQSGAHWSRALQAAQDSGATALIAQIRLRASLSAVAHRAIGRATQLVAEARASINEGPELGGAVRALLNEAEGTIANHWQRHRDARTHWMRARTWYAEDDAFYDVARLDGLLAQLSYRLGDVRSFVARWELACRAANRGGFSVPLEIEQRILHPLIVGQVEATRYARRHRTDVRHSGTDIQVDRRSGTLTVFGNHYVLGPQSQLIRLVCALIRSGHSGMGPSILCRRLWRQEAFTPRTFNRLKVHIHRLREVIGPEHDVILTERSPAGKRQVSYRWNPTVTAQIG